MTCEKQPRSPQRPETPGIVAAEITDGQQDTRDALEGAPESPKKLYPADWPSHRDRGITPSGMPLATKKSLAKLYRPKKPEEIAAIAQLRAYFDDRRKKHVERFLPSHSA